MQVDQIFLSTLFGFLSFISPCVLPMVPAYISLMSGLSVQDLRGEGEKSKVRRGRVLLHSLMFILGFADVFILFFYVFQALGLVIPNFPMWLNLVGGVVVLIFGLNMMGILRIRFLNLTASSNLDAKRMSYAGSFILGFSFALGWSPCVGPFLVGIMTMAMAPGATAYWGLLLIFFYILGLGIPFFLTGLATRALLGVFGWIKRHYAIVEMVSGLLLVFLAVVLLSDPVLKATTGEGTGGIAMISNMLVSEAEEEKTPAEEEGEAIEVKGEYKFGNGAMSEKYTPKRGEKLPAFKIALEDGSILTVPDDFAGEKVLFIDFWGTWCHNCIQGMPNIIKLQSNHVDDLQVIGVASKSKPGDTKRLSKKMGINYIIAMDSDISSTYGVTAYPTAVFVDKDGNITEIIIGEQTMEQLEKQYEDTLAGTTRETAINYSILFIFLGAHVVIATVVIIVRTSRKRRKKREDETA